MAKAGRRKILFRIWGGVFIIFLFLGIFYWRYSFKDHLLEFAPVDSVLYASAKNPIWAKTKGEISNLPFANFFNQADQIFNLNLKDILPSTSQTSFLLLPNQETNTLDWVFIFKLKNPYLVFQKERDKIEKIKTVLSTQPYYLELKKSIFAVSNSAEALLAIAEVKNQTTFSLVGQLNEKKWGDDFFNLYLNVNRLKSYLNQDDFLSKFFKSFAQGNIYLSLNKDKNFWRLKLEGGSPHQFPMRDWDPDSDVGTSPTQTLTLNLPNNFLFFASGINLSGFFNQLQNSDLAIKDFFEQTAVNFERIYQTDPQKNIFDLFSQGGEIVVLGENKDLFWGFDYVLVLAKPSLDKLDYFEKLIKIILAQKLPKKVSHSLPDGTKVIELVAEPEEFLWQQNSLSGGQAVRYLTEPALNFQIAYLVLADKILIGSSAESIEKLILTKDISLTTLKSSCGLSKSDGFFVFNAHQPNQLLPLTYYLPTGLILAATQNENLVGCIFD